MTPITYEQAREAAHAIAAEYPDDTGHLAEITVEQRSELHRRLDSHWADFRATTLRDVIQAAIDGRRVELDNSIFPKMPKRIRAARRRAGKAACKAHDMLTSRRRIARSCGVHLARIQATEAATGKRISTGGLNDRAGEIIAAYEAGGTNEAVAKQFDTNLDTLSLFRKRWLIPSRPRGRTDFDLIASAKTLRERAAELLARADAIDAQRDQHRKEAA